MSTLEYTEAAFDLVKRAGLKMNDAYIKCENCDNNIKSLLIIVAIDTAFLLEEIGELNSYLREEYEGK